LRLQLSPYGGTNCNLGSPGKLHRNWPPMTGSIAVTLCGATDQSPLLPVFALIKLVFTLRRREGMTREEFQRYWREQHAPLVQRHASTLGIRRYVQTHSRDTDVDGVLADERRFIDLPRSPLWLGEENVVVGRQ
jgi:EthD domain-containing protein